MTHSLLDLGSYALARWRSGRPSVLPVRRHRLDLSAQDDLGHETMHRVGTEAHLVTQRRRQGYDAPLAPMGMVLGAPLLRRL